MAGEVIQRIKQKENEAAKLIENARAEAKQLLGRARDGKADLIREKDPLLQEEESTIKAKYERETAQIVKEIEKEENKTIEEISTVCEKSLDKVVDYITGEIVKE